MKNIEILPFDREYLIAAAKEAGFELSAQRTPVIMILPRPPPSFSSSQQ